MRFPIVLKNVLKSLTNFGYLQLIQSLPKIARFGFKGLQYLTLNLRDWRDSNPRPAA